MQLRTGMSLCLVAIAGTQANAQRAGSRAPANMPRVVVNDNRHSAGTLQGKVLTVKLDARVGEWRPDGEEAPGAAVPAFAEVGQPTRIPGPLIRVPAGTEVVLSLHNAL